MSFLKSRQSLFVLFVLFVFILLLPYLFRLANENSVFIGSEAHYHARMASHLAENPFIKSDPLLSVRYHSEPYHYLLAAFSLFMPVELVSVFLPVLLGALSFLFLFLVLSGLKLDYLRSLFILFVFVFSPFFIACFSLSSPRALIVLLSLFVFYFFTRKGRSAFILALAGFLLLSLSDFFPSLFVLLALLVFCFYNRRYLSRFYCVLAVLLFVGIAFHLPFYVISDAVHAPVYGGLISDLGAVYGFSVFSLLLGLLGVFFVWKSGKHFCLAYLALLLVFLVSFIFSRFFVYSSFAVCFFAGSAFYLLFARKWRLNALKNFALLVIFCGFLFSALSHVIILGELAPSAKFVNCLEWVRGNTPVSAVFLAPQEDGFFIEFWAERPVLMDSFHFSGQAKEDTEIIWKSFDLTQTRALLSGNNVSFLVLREDWLSGSDASGLAFLLGNDETFKRKYHNTECEVWTLRV